MSHKQILHELAENRAELECRSDANEADTRKLLIDPLLDYLGYPADFRQSEHQDRQNRPDEIIYRAKASQEDSRSAALIILEAKSLGTDFERTAQGRGDAPKRQIRRYLRDHTAAGEATHGVLTDGLRWYVLRRTGFRNDMETVTEINIFSDDTKDGLGRLYDLLCHESLTALSRPLSRVKSRETALSIIAAVADGKPPAEIVNLLAPERQPQKPIQVELELYGKAADAEQADWDSTDWDWGCNISGYQQTLPAPPRLARL